MFIPTQEERYSKRTMVTLILCVIVPSAIYAYFNAEQFYFPVLSVSGVLNIFLFFARPLAFAFSAIGVPDLAYGGFLWGGIICSLIVHGIIVALIYRSKVTPKMAITMAIVLGFSDLLALKLISAGVLAVG